MENALLDSMRVQNFETKPKQQALRDEWSLWQNGIDYHGGLLQGKRLTDWDWEKMGDRKPPIEI